MENVFKIPTNCPYCGQLVNYLNHKHHLYMYCTEEKPKTLFDGIEKKVKIKYDYDCKHYFGTISAENAEMAQCAEIDARLAYQKAEKLEKQMYQQQYQQDYEMQQKVDFLISKVEELENRIKSLENGVLPCP